MTNCLGKLITSVAVALQSSLLEIQVYEKYFHGSLLPFSELKVWVCFSGNTVSGEENKEKSYLQHSGIGGHLPFALPSLCMPSPGMKCRSLDLGWPRAWGGFVNLMSCRLFHTTNWSLHTLPSYKSLPCFMSFQTASSLWSPAVEQNSWGYWKLYGILLFASERRPYVSDKTEG